MVVALLFLAPQVTASSQHLLLASAGDAQQSRTLKPACFLVMLLSCCHQASGLPRLLITSASLVCQQQGPNCPAHSTRLVPVPLTHQLWPMTGGCSEAALCCAVQDRDHNFCLSLFWNYWWPLIFILYPFLGRIWCAICPFMIYGEVMQRWRMASGVVLQKWPREECEGLWLPGLLHCLFSEASCPHQVQTCRDGLVIRDVWRAQGPH